MLLDASIATLQGIVLPPVFVVNARAQTKLPADASFHVKVPPPVPAESEYFPLPGSKSVVPVNWPTLMTFPTGSTAISRAIDDGASVAVQAMVTLAGLE